MPLDIRLRAFPGAITLPHASRATNPYSRAAALASGLSSEASRVVDAQDAKPEPTKDAVVV